MILQPNQNPLLLRVFMDLFCAFVRVNLLADKVKSYPFLLSGLKFLSMAALLSAMTSACVDSLTSV